MSKHRGERLGVSFLGGGGLEKKSRSENAGLALTAVPIDEKFVM